MKRFTVISLILLALSAPSWACGGDYGTHNNYMFSVFPREMMAAEIYADRLNGFWKSYSNGAMETFDSEEAMTIAKNKRDNEMVAYLTELAKYLEISDQLRETWDYPTKEQLQQRQQTLKTMVAKSASYTGARLQPQWSLLRMRANMVLGLHDANITFWQQKASKMAPSVYREMMESLYAAALARQGQTAQACDIYAKQGDMRSIKWALRKMRNLGGIRTIFNVQPDSPTMNFLVQDFVNNAQETLDSGDDKEWVEETLDSRIIIKRDVDAFITYANEIVAQGKTQVPCMWMTAVGELQYLYGQHEAALTTLNKAVNMAGTPRMKDNARAIRLIASVKPAAINSEYGQWLTGELKWLQSKIKEEGKQDRENQYNFFDNHYYDILDRLVYQNLVPKYKESGRNDIATAFIDYMGNGQLIDAGYDQKTRGYSSDMFGCLDEMTPQELKQYMSFAQSKGGDALEQYLKTFINPYKDYLNDILGTKYLALGQYKEALDYLNQVPMSFTKDQAIWFYMAQRDYTQPRWMGKQEADEEGFQAHANSLRTNKKIDFCKEMTQLQSQYTLANNEKRAQLAYELATRYYQASYLGDCWWLTEYGQSICDTARADRPDYVQIAFDYLKESAKSNDPTLKLNSLYGLAFIPIDEWCDRGWNWETDRRKITPHRNSRQFKALNELYRYVNSGQAPQTEYVSNCAELKLFKKFI